MKHSKERIGLPEDGSEAVSVWICAELGCDQMVPSQLRDGAAQDVHSALIWPLFSGHGPLIGIGWELHACFFAPFPLNLGDCTFVNCVGRYEVVILVHEEQGYHVSKMIWCLHLVSEWGQKAYAKPCCFLGHQVFCSSSFFPLSLTAVFSAKCSLSSQLFPTSAWDS